MAQKKLSERIAERTQGQGEIGRKQQYQAVFLSLREDIEEAYGAGWKVKAIWETLHLEKKFNGTYECFLSYFNKKIKENDLPHAQISSGSQQELLAEQKKLAHSASKAISKTGSATSKGIQDFRYDPNDDISELMAPASEE